MDPAPLSTRIEALGDAALVIHFGERIDPLVNAHVLASTERLRAAAWPGILDLIPAYATLTVCYDPGEWLAAQLRERLVRLLSARRPWGRQSSAQAARR
jgi:allophanate hydrolase subunit 1